MRISFTKLGSEQCEKCEKFELNKNAHDHEVNIKELQATLDGEPDSIPVNETVCDKCREYLHHRKVAETTRRLYQADANMEIQSGTSVRSVDLQKVIMLPRMPGNKTAVFTKRIVAFHETFAAVGVREKKKKKKNNISVIWHEGIAGRKQEEITSAFVKALKHERDQKHIIYWLDNCAAQNKNW